LDWSGPEDSQSDGRSRSMNTAGRSLRNIGQMSLDLEISEQSWMLNPWTYSVADSPAKTFPLPDDAKESTVKTAYYGRNSQESFAWYDRDTSSWKTSQLCLSGEWAEFSQTWPAMGTMRNGSVSQPPHSARRIIGIDSSLLDIDDGPRLFAPINSPSVNVATNASVPNATCITSNATVRDRIRKLKMVGKWSGNHGVWWPTLRATEWKGTGPFRSKAYRHRLNRWYLDAVVQEIEQQSGRLNPDWLDWFMGLPVGWSALDPSET
jgi:hypothetical protein